MTTLHHKTQFSAVLEKSENGATLLPTVEVNHSCLFQMGPSSAPLPPAGNSTHMLPGDI